MASAAEDGHPPDRVPGIGSPHAGENRSRDAGPGRAGEGGVGGRHESPKPGTDVFMAVVVLALLALLAAVVIPAALGG